MKPLMNLDEVGFDDVEDNGLYTSRRGQISDHIGAKSLGYNLTVLPPGKAQCPFHCHHGEEEMFFILEACEYPDSRKVLIAAGKRGERALRRIFRAENTVDYYDRENTGP